MTDRPPSQHRVFGAWKDTDPVHLCQPEPHQRLAWCGARQQFRHRERDGDLSDVTCPRCLTQIRRDQPLSFGSRG